ncbi:unnamed protein product [Prunus brigantina]
MRRTLILQQPVLKKNQEREQTLKLHGTGNTPRVEGIIAQLPPGHSKEYHSIS